MGTAKVMEVMDVLESDVLEFDFSAELTPKGATIPSLSALTWEVESDGRDPRPLLSLVGPAELASSYLVKRKMECRGYPGRYSIRVVAVASDGIKHVAAMVVPVKRLGVPVQP